MSRVDLSGELKASIIAAIKQGNGKIIDAAATALTSWARGGYDEATAVHEEFPTLFCDWCGRPHRSDECNAQLAKHPHS